MFFLNTTQSRRISSALIAVLVLLLAPLHIFAGGGQEEEANVVHVYSHRHYDTDQALFDRFEELTGIEVQVVEAGADELIQRLAAEGENTPADLLITVDAGRLYQAAEQDLLQSIESETVDSLLPEHLRDPDGEWYALTIRARIIAYHQERADRSMLSTYEALTGDEFEGSIAIRSSSNIYNISLLSSIIANLGEDAALDWAQSMTRSFARAPQGNDRDQLRAVAGGEADFAVVNTYYVGRMLTSTDPAEVEVARRVGVFFPNQPGSGGSERGTHINISGAGVTRHADNVDGAVQLLEFLLGDEAQGLFARANYEYPVRDGIALAPEVAAWGEFVADTLSLEALGANARRATMIFDEVGWQ